MVRFIVTHQLLFQSESECQGVTDEVVSLINEKLPPDYAWPGNFRELEQCVRNILIRQDYRPPVNNEENAEQRAVDFSSRLLACKLSSDDLLRHYYTLVYKNTGSYKAAAEVLEVDWRTVRDKVDPGLLKVQLVT
jgi:transcriptional regulator with PAS, ATPase and Fis domain